MTIDEKISYTFECKANFFARVSRRRSYRSELSFVEVFENTDDNTICRKRIMARQTLNAPTWKQALLFTFNRGIFKIQVKNQYMFFGNGKIISEKGVILYDSDKSMVEKSVFSMPEAKQFSDIFIKTVLPTLAKTLKCLKIQEGSDIRRNGQSPDAIGSEMDKKLIKCAKESLKLLEIQ